MPTLIKGVEVTTDDWLIVDGEDPVLTAVHEGRPLLYPASLFAERRPRLEPREVALGVWLDGEHEPDVLAPFIGELDLIAIRFGSMNDGRGLSLAVLLRQRYAFTKELRAIGAVHEDLLPYMRRCGFDSFLIPDGRDPAIALAVLSRAGNHYQASTIEPAPAFRRIKRG